MELFPAGQTNNILKIVTVARWFFMTAVVIGFIVSGFELLFASSFPERRLEILLRSYLAIEAAFWCLKFKRLSVATGRLK